MRIYTKFGDKGNTSLFGGATVSKSDLRVDAYGNIDELNALLGVVLSSGTQKELSNVLKSSLKIIQKDLFVIGTELATKGTKPKKILLPSRISELEAEIDALDAQLPLLRNFILPGGSKTSSLLHLARTICRRAERSIVALAQKETINPEIVVYINRVGDLLFMHARYANYKSRIPETIWKGHQEKQ